jgi:hypothetical protein
MDVTQCLITVATWPLLTTLGGMHIPLRGRALWLICHTCHLFEKIISRYQLKKLSKTDGNPGIMDPPVQEVLGKSFFLISPSAPHMVLKYVKTTIKI